MLPMVLGKTTPRLCAIMPARIAATDPFQPLGEITGCGPYTYDATGREAGKRVIYQRYEPYIPSRMPVSGSAGAKEATIERIEWAVMNDAAEAQAALLGGTIDWWQAPPARSLGPLLADKGVRLRPPLSRGSIAALRFNHLHKPFDRPEVRRAIFAAVSQSAYMTALGGGYGPDWRDRVGFFCPDSPSASNAGMEDLAAAADPTRARRELEAAGGVDAPLVLLVNADRDVDKRLAGVTEAMLKGLGLAVQVQALAADAYETRLADTRPPADGGWHLSHACVAGDEQADPVGHTLLRAGGRSAAAGWPTIPRIETLVEAWLSAPDASWQRRFVDQIQRIAFAELPYVPLGQFFPPSAIRSNLKGVLDGPPMFWNIERE
jgi:peptide/nickel transport system substrate-binding protein